jgi:hypothetical protein
MLVNVYGETKSKNWRIGAEDAKAPMATCGYFNLNHAASTEIKYYPILTMEIMVLNWTIYRKIIRYKLVTKKLKDLLYTSSIGSSKHNNRGINCWQILLKINYESGIISQSLCRAHISKCATIPICNLIISSKWYWFSIVSMLQFVLQK